MAINRGCLPSINIDVTPLNQMRKRWCLFAHGKWAYIANLFNHYQVAANLFSHIFLEPRFLLFLSTPMPMVITPKMANISLKLENYANAVSNRMSNERHSSGLADSSRASWSFIGIGNDIESKWQHAIAVPNNTLSLFKLGTQFAIVVQSSQLIYSGKRLKYEANDMAKQNKCLLGLRLGPIFPADDPFRSLIKIHK